MIYELINWPVAHEPTFWALVFIFIIGYVFGAGRHGHWHKWFDL